MYSAGQQASRIWPPAGVAPAKVQERSKTINSVGRRLVVARNVGDATSTALVPTIPDMKIGLRCGDEYDVLSP